MTSDKTAPTRSRPRATTTSSSTGPSAWTERRRSSAASSSEVGAQSVIDVGAGQRAALGDVRRVGDGRRRGRPRRLDARAGRGEHRGARRDDRRGRRRAPRWSAPASPSSRLAGSGRRTRSSARATRCPTSTGTPDCAQRSPTSLQSCGPGGALVLHLLNHGRLLDKRPRAIPPVVRDTAEGTKVFVRVIDYPAGRRVPRLRLRHARARPVRRLGDDASALPAHGHSR